MITTLTIKNFKSIQLLDALSLGQVNVFIGANGSGKSNLLEAVGVLSAAANGVVDDQTLIRRGVRPNFSAVDSSSEIMLSATFRPTQGDAEAMYEVTLCNSTEKGEGIDTYRGVAYSQIDNRMLSGSPRDLLKILREYVIYSPITPILRGIMPDNTAHFPLGLYGGQLVEAVQSLLNVREEKFGVLDLDELLALFNWGKTISVGLPLNNIIPSIAPTARQAIQFQDIWMNEGGRALSSHDVSEGTLHVLFALVLAMHSQSPRFLAIENFGQIFHPRLARAITQLFCRLILASNPSRQVLLTTHNPSVLDGLNLLDNRIRLFVVERGFETGGDTKVYRVQVSGDILQAQQDGLSLSNLWVMGRLGGAPLI